MVDLVLQLLEFQIHPGLNNLHLIRREMTETALQFQVILDGPAFLRDFHRQLVNAVLHLVEGKDSRLEGEASELDAGLGGGPPSGGAGH